MKSYNLPAWVDLGAGRSAVAVGAGGRHTCVILDNGSLMCMGADNDGQVGDGAELAVKQRRQTYACAC